MGMAYTRRTLLRSATALVVTPWLELAVRAEKHQAATSSTQAVTGAGVRNPLTYVNPEFRAALAKHPTQNFDAKVLETARAYVKRQPQVPLPPGVSEKFVTVPNEAPKVRVYVAGDSPGASKPGILHIHGGGYVLGSAAITPAELDLVKKFDCVVVSVDYRLAPEAQFPASLEDNYAALRWMYENAKELGIDTARIAVKGESAGGGHAAMLTLAVRDRKEFTFCQQILIYPMLDDRTGSTREVAPYIGHFIWTPQSNQFGWTSLLGVPAGSKTVPINSVPARVENLAGLPPAFIGVGSIDLFASEDVNYSRRLLEAGVPTELMVVPGGYHGFDIFNTDAPLTVLFENAWAGALRRAFTNGRT